jgi:glucose/arabinose dehydrogenase
LWIAVAIVAVACQALPAGSIAAPVRLDATKDTAPPPVEVQSVQAAPPATFDPATVTLSLEPFVSDVNQPTDLVSAHDGSGRLFLLEKAGRILIVRGRQRGTQPFLDITPLVGSRGAEQGLLGLAFHPQFANNGYFFVDYTDRNGDTMIVRYQVSSDPDAADPSTALMLFHIPKPAPNHNGGDLVFGPDGYLYIGTGDGGGAGDQFHNAQDKSALLGKMLRVDVDSGTPYGIPPDNPFIGENGARPEVWAYGLRNPWRYSFDRANDDLYVADVGQDRWEEIDVLAAGTGSGSNFGWPQLEATHCYPPSAACDPAGTVVPVAEYSHSLGCSVTGGYVYRGPQAPFAQGVYLYGDFCSGRIWGLDHAPDGSWRQTQLLQTALALSTFGEDEAGEIYVAGLDEGAIFHLVFSQP